MSEAVQGWKSLAYHWTKDIQLFLFILLSLTLFRVLMLFIYGNQTSDNSNLSDFLAVFWMGFRLDMGTAAAWILLTFIVSISSIWLRSHHKILKLRNFSALAFAIVSVLVFGIDIIYFKVYGDHFNQIILGLFEDDTSAILQTIWKEHHPIAYFSLFFVVMFFIHKALKMWMDFEPVIADKMILLKQRWQQIGTTVISVLLILLAMRGGAVSGAPLQMRHLFVTNDDFLNHMIMNPFAALRLTAKQQWQIHSSNGLEAYWPREQLADALQLISSNSSDYTEINIDKALIRIAPGFTGKKPKHIFMLLMESYPAWTLLPQYRSIGLSNGLIPFADAGITYLNFLPATRMTADSLSVLISGLPYPGLSVNREPRSLKQYPTSIAKIFNDLGYKTRFYYGGYIGWQRLDLFIKAQGFSEIYSAGDMKNAKRGNEWGIDDEYLFEYMQETIKDDEPSFNFILTTSNHSPYDLDLEAKGYPVKQFPSEITPGQSNALEVMGHHWYSDRELGKFIASMSKKVKSPLFAVTGDHPTRVLLKFANASTAETSSVPFVLYGPDVLYNMNVNTKVAGSHIDILPTLVEIAAPKGFEYSAFGKNMLSKTDTDVGLGKDFMNGLNFLTALDNPQQTILDGNTPARLNEPERAEALKKLNAMRAISWYRVREGAELNQ